MPSVSRWPRVPLHSLGETLAPPRLLARAAVGFPRRRGGQGRPPLPGWQLAAVILFRDMSIPRGVCRRPLWRGTNTHRIEVADPVCSGPPRRWVAAHKTTESPDARDPEKALAEAAALSGLSVPSDRESGPPVSWRSSGAEASPSPTGRTLSVDGKVRNGGRGVKPYPALVFAGFPIFSRFPNGPLPGARSDAPRSCHRPVLHSSG
jgi:hypothetical protein